MPRMNRRDACRIIATTPLLGSSMVSCAAGARTRAVYAPASPPRAFRGVWVATVDNIDWPSRPGLDPASQRAEIDNILDACRRLELNAVFLQVRPTCDALYRSEIEPWSAFLTGSQGLAPRPEYDPLAYWTQAAHERGIDLHAWVNPFRARHPISIGPDAPNHVVKRLPEIARDYRGHLWLDPGDRRSQDLALRVIDDLLTRYDIDGVHMDDYFYPYPDKDRPFPDEATYDDYRAGGGTLERDDWRRDNINRFVQATNDLVHRRRPGGLFTISPFGIWRPGHPEQVTGFDAYAGLYADAKRWMQEGWCDAMIPQLYWPIASKGQPFQPLMDWWADHNTMDRHLWAGLYLTRIKPEGSEETSWEPGEILDQLSVVESSPRVTGSVLFSMIGLMENRRGIADQLASGPMSAPALVPESTWLSAPRPDRPECRGERAGRAIQLTLTPGRGADTRRYAITLSERFSQRVADQGLAGWVVPAGAGRIRTTLVPAEPLPQVASLTVTPIGANGVTGRPTIIAI